MFGLANFAVRTLGTRSLGAEGLLWLDGVVRLVGSVGRCVYVNFTLRSFFVDFFFFYNGVYIRPFASSSSCM